MVGGYQLKENNMMSEKEINKILAEMGMDEIPPKDTARLAKIMKLLEPQKTVSNFKRWFWPITCVTLLILILLEYILLT